ncbi:MAG: flagellar biosynthetic protein FliO [Clostridiales bacterium]|nr:flagellar biosynthetic protein FliO [Clostridiales bacterium]
MNGSEILSMIGTVILMIAVFAGAYYVSKFVGKHYQPRYGDSRNMSVIESQSLGKDKALLIVKTAGKAFLIGSTPHEFTLISELDPDTLTEDSEYKPEKKDFSAILRNALTGKDKKRVEGEERK